MVTKLGKKSDEPIFKQIINLIPHSVLAKSINKFKSDESCSKYYTYDQLTRMLFGQQNKYLSLREIAMGIDQPPEFLDDIGLVQSPTKSTMCDGNAKRDCRVFEDIYLSLCQFYRAQHSRRPEYKEIEEMPDFDSQLQASFGTGAYSGYAGVLFYVGSQPHYGWLNVQIDPSQQFVTINSAGHQASAGLPAVA